MKILQCILSKLMVRITYEKLFLVLVFSCIDIIFLENDLPKLGGHLLLTINPLFATLSAIAPKFKLVFSGQNINSRQQNVKIEAGVHQIYDN